MSETRRGSDRGVDEIFGEAFVECKKKNSADVFDGYLDNVSMNINSFTKKREKEKERHGLDSKPNIQDFPHFPRLGLFSEHDWYPQSERGPSIAPP